MKKKGFLLLVIFALLSCKKETTLAENKIIGKSESSRIDKSQHEFPSDVASCSQSKYLFDAIPHLDSYNEYNFVKIDCAGTNIIAEYNHPKEKFFNIKIALYHEIDNNKVLFNTAKATYETLKQFKNKSNEISDLKILDNAYINFKKDIKYDKITYSGTYKSNYTLIIMVKGKNLSSKELADDFLNDYLNKINFVALK